MGFEKVLKPSAPHISAAEPRQCSAVDCWISEQKLVRPHVEAALAVYHHQSLGCSFIRPVRKSLNHFMHGAMCSWEWSADTRVVIVLLKMSL